MAFLRFSRDRRGYEHFYLVEPSGRGRARVLFWFRTPPNIKVGRTPFDPEVRRALEARYPHVVFDWAAIVETPIPPPVEPERWRERRRLERAMRAAQHEDAAGTADPAAETVELPLAAAGAGTPTFPDEAAPARDSAIASNSTASGGSTAPASGGEAAASAVGDSRPRRRRRRRRSKKNVQGAAPVVEPSVIQDSEDAADHGPDGE